MLCNKTARCNLMPTKLNGISFIFDQSNLPTRGNLKLITGDLSARGVAMEIVSKFSPLILIFYHEDENVCNSKQDRPICTRCIAAV